ncbi:hypothetical protein JM946_05015 [Steroidobacter sp. S1-65]|uniref:DUF1795 domain-containing protein n=1 Tax=Steroidobacter gossypii TaxID=2805490 RepID=A0ABS1WT06_9GAMM|nr:hypothetical protein [Steroidobacter gossypii]MBM0104091.1 hypothetical protein [Steroidobacter gossypii]
MIIHRLPELNLEIWTEQDPEWETHLSDVGDAFTFVAETPALTYPPAYMSWTVMPHLKLRETELEAAARGVLHQIAANYRTQPPKEIRQRSFGDLTGYEAILHAKSDKMPIDVLIFCGHREGRPAVVMQAVTLRDKLPHLSEHIRRSWTNVRYLD